MVAVDGTKIYANNKKKNNYTKKVLERKLAHINEEIIEYFNELDKNDRAEKDLVSLTDRKIKYENMLMDMRESGETQISTVDPDSRLMENKKGGLLFDFRMKSTD